MIMIMMGISGTPLVVLPDLPPHPPGGYGLLQGMVELDEWINTANSLENSAGDHSGHALIALPATAERSSPENAVGMCMLPAVGRRTWHQGMLVDDMTRSRGSS